MDSQTEVVETSQITLAIIGTNAKMTEIIAITTIDKRRISTNHGKNRNHKTAIIDAIPRLPTFQNPHQPQNKMKRSHPVFLSSKSQAHLQGHLKLRRLKLKVLYLIPHRDQK